MLSISAALTIVFYVDSSTASEAPTESARYLHYLVVSTPVWVWVLDRLAAGVYGRLARMSARAVLAILLLTMLVATAELVAEVPRYATWAAQNRQLIQLITARGVTAVYGGYWVHRVGAALDAAVRTVLKISGVPVTISKVGEFVLYQALSPVTLPD